MSLRAFGYLTRRFCPHGMPRAQAAVSSQRILSRSASVSAASTPARSLHTIRDLEVGGGAVAGVAAFAGLAGILFFKKHTDASGDVTDEEANEKPTAEKPVTNEVTDKKASQEVTDKETFVKQDMEARFRDWTKENGRSYKDDEEKAMRFEIFKETVRRVESYQPPLRPNCFADRTMEEQRKLSSTSVRRVESIKKKLMEHHRKTTE